MTKVLVFGITENPGGIESVIMNYYRHINQKEIQFDFLCNTDVVSYEDEIQKLGGKIYRITARSANYKQYKKCMKEFYQNHANEYSAIWVNVCSLANIDYLILAKQYGIKKRIIHCHNSQNMDSRFRKILHIFNRKILSKYATDFWTCSTDKDCINWFYNSRVTNKHNVVLINNAIDIEKFKFNANKRKEIRKQYNINADEILYCNIGRLHFQKNQLRLIKIFKEIHKMQPNSKLYLIGEGEDRDKIINSIHELKLDGSVNLLGVRNDVADIINMFDCFIFPSLFEGLPLALVEAQSNGIKVFASNSISKKVKLISNFEFFDLNDKDNDIARHICSASLDRERDLQMIDKKGYNINSEVKKVEKLLKDGN